MMQRKRRQPNIVWSTFVLMLMVGIWVTLAPVQVGGPAAYIIVNGNSMEPVYRRGDLVILHAAAVYQVGDIVTYHHPEIGPVIHRIIAQQGNQLTLKGDNNAWNDAYRPTLTDVIGKAWLHIPAVGKYLTAARSPFILALLAMALAVVVAGPGQKQKLGRNRRRKQYSAQGAFIMQERVDSRGTVCVLLAVIALASLVLALFAFLRPISRTVTVDVPYQQTGQFNYTATAPSGIYDSDIAQTGDPIFRQLTRSVPVKFDYQFTAEQRATVSGTYLLNLEISDGNGWHRTVELQPEQTFTGSSFTSSGIIDLAKIEKLLANFEKQIGSAPRSYTLTIAPAVQLRGDLQGQALQDEFRPRLDFQLAQSLLQPVASGTTPFKPVQAGVLSGIRTEPNALSLLAFQADIALVRRIAPISLVLALLGLIMVGVPLFQAIQQDQAFRIRLNYGPLLVAVCDKSALHSDHIIDVASIDDLAKLAERVGGPILYTPSDLTFGYIVLDNGRAYRYAASASPAAAKPVETSADDAWQQAFLDTLRDTGRVAAACSAAGVWLVTANQERSRSPEFARAWDVAQAQSRQVQMQGGIPS